jgi:prepilin-type N-terminal cleavage/methylation domain-containing protein
MSSVGGGSIVVMKKFSFSLVELLVVISILAVLSSLLGPSMKRVFFQVGMTSCKNNLKDIGIGFIIYSEDYDSFYPKNTNKRNRPYQLGRDGGGQAIFEMLQPYMKEFKKTFMCEGAKENSYWETSSRKHEGVDQLADDADDNDIISTAYNMYFNVDGDNTIWDTDENQMKQLGDMFTIGPWQGYPNELASFNFMVSDLNNLGGSHIPSWKFRRPNYLGSQHGTSGPNQTPFNWRGYEWTNNYLRDDGSVLGHFQVFPPEYYHNGWSQRGVIHKSFFVTNNNHTQIHLDIPRELIRVSNL